MMQPSNVKPNANLRPIKFDAWSETTHARSITSKKYSLRGRKNRRCMILLLIATILIILTITLLAIWAPKNTAQTAQSESTTTDIIESTTTFVALTTTSTETTVTATATTTSTMSTTLTTTSSSTTSSSSMTSSPTTTTESTVESTTEFAAEFTIESTTQPTAVFPAESTTTSTAETTPESSTTLVVTSAKQPTTISTITAKSTTTSSTSTTASSTTTSSTTSTTTTRSTTTSSTTSTIVTTTPPPPGIIPLDAVNGTIAGVYNTTVGRNSMPATPGIGVGQYISTESPVNACDNDTATKYVSFGPCYQGLNNVTCGLRTGFYLQLRRNLSLVTGLRVCTANDFPERDPLAVSLEGSNHSGTNLTLGTSWTLIYNGSSGLETHPDRYTCGAVQLINNTIQYKSYRFLVSGKRNISSCVQYSEVQLYGY